MNILFLPIFVSLFAVFFAFVFIKIIRKASSGTGKQIEISLAIREGAISYLKRQYLAILPVALVLFLILLFRFDFKTAIGFSIGALLSAISGFVGMMISTEANVKVAEAAKKGVRPAFNLAFRAGSVTGLLVVGLGLFAVAGFYLLTKDLKALVALGFGGSLISVFARLGGGIYTKAADVGADLVGKIEKHIPEDDPRNPAVIADQVGDNVGDVAGMAADLFETYTVTLIAVMILGSLLFPGNPQAILLPFFLASVAILASIISLFFVRVGKKGDIMQALNKGITGSIILSGIGFFPFVKSASPFLDISWLRLYIPAIMGLGIAGGMFLATAHFTSKKFKPVQSIAQSSQGGPGPNIITGLAVGMRSTALPIIIICLGIFISFSFGGIYGLAIASLSMLSLAGIIVALDSYGPITDNASGIAQMSQLSSQVRAVTDPLDAVGNTTKAVTKAYAIASAGLAAL